MAILPAVAVVPNLLERFTWVMIERYHLVLAVAALSAGGVLAATNRHLARLSDDRTLALAGVLAAVLGGLGSARSEPWLLAAAVVVLQPSRADRPHPLGRWAVPMAVASAAGIWSAVPDTEAPLVVAAVFAPIGLSNVIADRSTSQLGCAAMVVALLGATWVGSAGWGAAMVTGTAVGMVLIAPVVLGFGRYGLTVAGLRLVLGAHLLVALILPRGIMRRPVPVAAGIAAAAIVALVLIARVLRRSEPVGEPSVRPST